MGFDSNQTNKHIRDEWMLWINLFLKKIKLKKQFENQGEEDFLENQALPVWIKLRELKRSEKIVGVFYPKIETFRLNMK